MTAPTNHRRKSKNPLTRRRRPDMTVDGLGEPIALLEGVSVWPSIFLVVVAWILSICLIVDAWRGLDDNIKEISKDMELKNPGDAEEKKDRKCDLLRNVFVYKIYDKKKNARDGIIAKEAWKEYEDVNLPCARFIRVLFLTIVMILLYLGLCLIYGDPHSPLRGKNILVSYIWPIVIWLFTFSLIFLVFLVGDATYWCLRFVNILRGGTVEWPYPTHRKYGKELKFHDPLLDEWIDLSFIAKRTKCISKLIYYPSAILAIAIISRSTAFANYPPNPPVIIIEALGFLGVFGCAMMLGFSAEKARQTTKAKLKAGISMVQAAKSPGVKTEQLRTLLQLVDDLDEGAFVPLWRQPPIRALLLPISGIGWTALLEYGLLSGL